MFCKFEFRGGARPWFWLVSHSPSFEPAASCKPAKSEVIRYSHCHMLTRMITILNCAFTTVFSELPKPKTFHSNNSLAGFIWFSNGGYHISAYSKGLGITTYRLQSQAYTIAGLQLLPMSTRNNCLQRLRLVTESPSDQLRGDWKNAPIKLFFGALSYEKCSVILILHILLVTSWKDHQKTVLFAKSWHGLLCLLGCYTVIYAQSIVHQSNFLTT